MQYSIIKDEKPVNTVEKIKKVLKSLKINLIEEYYNENSIPVSVRLCFNNNRFFGTNGKGTCKINATASAYAEFMERIQNLYIHWNWYDISQIIPDRICVKKYVKYDNENIKKYFHKKVQIFEKLKKNNIHQEDLVLLPFYGVKTKNVTNLPYNIISKMKGTNGMAAGNTLEEALVQGLSEVCERYVVRKIFMEKLSLPDVPNELYLKYENIKKMIERFEQLGYKVVVKDASLNGLFPVICTIIEDPERNIFCPSFGAQPSLPLSIERSLTEFAQGKNLSLSKKSYFSCYSKEKLKYAKTEKICMSMYLHKVAFEKTKELEKIFFNKEHSYEFSEKTWVLEDESISNKKLLNFLQKKILKTFDEIYVRDVSFLGFPSVDIFVPEMSEQLSYSEENFLARKLDMDWAQYYSSLDRFDYTLENLMNLADIYTVWDTLISEKIFNVSFEYVATLCAIAMDDAKRVIKYIGIMLGQNRLINNLSEDQRIVFEIIKKYYNYKKLNDNLDIIKEKLGKKYNIDSVEMALEVINGLDYETILQIVLKPLNVRKCKYKTLIKNLAHKYKKNLPNQKLSFQNVF